MREVFAPVVRGLAMTFRELEVHTHTVTRPSRLRSIHAVRISVVMNQWKSDDFTAAV